MEHSLDSYIRHCILAEHERLRLVHAKQKSILGGELLTTDYLCSGKFL